jgi:enoyl-CoA hydratase/carnithine racemase
MSDYRLTLVDRILTAELHRPKKKNALTIPMVEALAEELESYHGREGVRVLVLTGAGGSFCAGADLVENAPIIQAGGEGVQRSMAAFHRLLLSVWNFGGPSIAAVPGDAVGFGMDLSIACDLRVAGRSARFGHRFHRIALVPDGGSSLTLPRLVGLHRAMELTMLGEMVGAEEALRIGLVNQVVEDAELPSATGELAARLAAGPPIAQRLTKANYRAALGCTMEEALRHEAEAQMRCLLSTDLMAGIVGWMQGTPPEFTGH